MYVKINPTSLLGIANSISDFLDEVYHDIIYFYNLPNVEYTVCQVHTYIYYS
jgi:hypothetical protein